MKSKAWAFKLGHVTGNTMLTQWVVMVLQCTAGIISLLTHICIPVALNIDVHPKLTYEHQSPYHQGLHTQLCNPSCSIPANPSQIHIFSQARYKLLAKG